MLNCPDQHPLRAQVTGEIHARPVPSIARSVSVVYLAMLKPAEDPQAARVQLAKFLDTMGLPPLGDSDSCYYHSLGDAELRWESHQEFSSYMLILPQDDTACFPDLEFPEWWQDLICEVPGQMVNGVRVEIRDAAPPEQPLHSLPREFQGNWVIGSRVVDDAASVFTDFHQDSLGLTRYLVYNQGLSPFQGGRSCQRLLESDTYRIMALLGFPLARASWPTIRQLDSELGELMSRITEKAVSSSDQAMLDELGKLATRIGRLRADTSFRFSASRAYAEIALKRLADLREQRWPGTSSMLKFVERRFLPAMQTCRDADTHLEHLSQRIGQATALLRTRVNLNQELQSQQLLDAINQRGETQLRLQQVVEGFSVIAITYYLVSLLKVILETGSPFPEWTALPGFKLAAVGLLAVTVSFYIRRRKKRLINPPGSSKP